MKTTLPFLLVLLIFSGCARTSSPQPTPTPSPTIAAPSGKSYPAKGIVKSINNKEGSLEIDHEDIEGLMPAMVMEWPLKDPKQLETLKVGDKIEFVLLETGNEQIITEVKKVP